VIQNRRYQRNIRSLAAFQRDDEQRADADERPLYPVRHGYLLRARGFHCAP